MVFKASTRKARIYKGAEIKNFFGQNRTESANLLDFPLGQFIYNMNLEYLYSSSNVFVRTRRGSSLIFDIVNMPKGAGNYIYNLTDQYYVWVDSLGDLKSYKTAELELKTKLAGSEQHYFVPYGLGTLSALYGLSVTDGIYKISGSTPAYSEITSPTGMVHFGFSPLAGRMFGVKDHTVYWTKVQVSSATLNNLEDWDIGTNDSIVSPDSGKGFKAYITDGQIEYFFKDSGVWALPNSNEATANWEFPKLSADTGTLSPKTVKYGRYGQAPGIIHLGTDKTLRFLNASIIRNSGTLPTIDGGDSKIISKTFQDILNEIPDAYMYLCTADYKDKYYILNIPGPNQTEITRTLIIDTEKLIPSKGSDILQPYWFEATNMEYTEFIKREASNKWYGVHKNGYISQIFVNDVYVDNVPTRVDSSGSLAIKYYGYLGWAKASSYEVQFMGSYLYWASQGDWAINFFANSFVEGKAVPQYDDGNSVELRPNQAGGSYFDVSQFDVARFSSSTGQLSQRVNKNLRGNYFIYGFYGETKNQWATVYGIAPLYKQLRTSPVGVR